jgi:hypothetical protein
MILVNVLCLVVGAIAGGFIVKNNKDKSFAILDTAKKAAENELELVKAKLKK